MAQSGYTPIILYYNNTTSTAPSLANLQTGELAVNTFSGKLYYRTSAGAVSVIADASTVAPVTTLSFGSTGLTPSTATSGAITVAGTLGAANGGTGITSLGTGVATALGQNVTGTGGLVLATSATLTSPTFVTPALGTPASGTLTNCTFPTLNQNTTGTAANVTGVVLAANGGTGQSSFTAGDMLYYASGTTFTKLGIGSNGYVLTSNGSAPQWTSGSSFGVTSFSTSLSGLTPSSLSGGAITLAGTLGATSGGTGFTTYATGDLIYASATNTLSKLTAGTNGYVLTLSAGVPTWAAGGSGGVSSFSAGSTGLTPSTATTGAITVAGTLVSGNGGTGFSTYATGDLIYASASNTLSKLTAGTNGYVLTLAAGVPSWAAASGGMTSINFGTTGLTPATATGGVVNVAGTLVAGNGGTGLSTFAIGDIMYASATTPTISKLAIGTAGQVMVVNSGGTAPQWSAQSTLAVGTATNVAGGAAGSILYQSGAGVTTTLAIGTAYNILAVNAGGTAPSYQTQTSLLDNNFSSVQGTILYRSATAWTALGTGTAGYYLQTGGAGANPLWAAVAAGLTGFTAALNVAAPNATNNVSSITASGGTTDQFIAISPKGSGGLIGRIPDSGTSNGNVRGTYALDLQFLITAATQVASGDRSVILGGSQNTASASFSIVIGGQSNTNTGSNSAIIGGNTNSISQANSVVLSGQYGKDRGVAAVVQPSSNTSLSGGNQTRTTILAAATTDATATIADTLGSNNSASNRNVNLEDNTIYSFTAYVVAGVTGAGNAKMWTIKGGIKRGSGVGTTVLVGTPAVNIDAADAGASTWVVTATADTATGILKFTCTGQAATTIKWTIRCITIEAGY